MLQPRARARISSNRRCDECTFVGDNTQWDIEGSAAVGMNPVLLDREGHHMEYHGQRISDLKALL
jgi:FMN phosphatase YigB (HAD superfamily)